MATPPIRSPFPCRDCGSPVESGGIVHVPGCSVRFLTGVAAPVAKPARRPRAKVQRARNVPGYDSYGRRKYVPGPECARCGAPRVDGVITHRPHCVFQRLKIVAA